MRKLFQVTIVLVSFIAKPAVADQLLLGGGPSAYSNVIYSGGQIAQFMNVYNTADVTDLTVWAAGSGSGDFSFQLNRISVNDPLSGSVILTRTFAIPNTGLNAGNVVPFEIEINSILSGNYAFTISPFGGDILMEGGGVTYQQFGGTGQLWIRNTTNDPWAFAPAPASPPTHYTLEGTPRVPEPSTFLLFGIGLLIVATTVRTCSHKPGIVQAFILADLSAASFVI